MALWILVTGILLVVALGLADFLFLRLRMMRLGSTGEEVNRPLPGDEFIIKPILRTTRAIAINAPPERIWPWLAQMGQGRGGFYSYEWLENLVRLDIHNSDRYIPELQDIKPGDLIPFWRCAGVNVVDLELMPWKDVTVMEQRQRFLKDDQLN